MLPSVKRRRQGRWAAGLLAWALAVQAPSAGATTVTPVTVEALTQQSDEVLVATVLRAASRWQGGVIVTDHTLRVAAVFKGAVSLQSEVVVTVAGGVVGRVAQTIAEVPVPVVGRSYVWFVQRGDGGARYLAHMTAAVVPLRVAPGEARVVAEAPEALVTAPSQGVSGVSAGPRALAFESLARVIQGAAP